MANTQPLKGFRDFLPAEAAARQWLKNQMIKVFAKWGYEPLETPTLEPSELFGGNVGEDEKLFFQFKDLGDRDVMLRYDQTVPTCRVIGQYFNQLVFPFRRYQIQTAFRAEKPQAGRFREFMQADADLFGLASPLADAEVIAVMLDVYKSLGFTKAIALINNRELLKDISYPAISSIDKLEKIGLDGVIADMAKKNISAADANRYLAIVQNLQPDETLKTIFNYLDSAGFAGWYKFEPTLARSLSYSQGPIWEIKIPDYKNGSVGGGERYDGLLEKISGQSIPATGFGIGFDRTLQACQQMGLIPPYTPSTQILVTIFSPDLFDKSLELSNSLRQMGIACEVFPDTQTKLEKQLKYAARKNIPYVAFFGPEETAANTLKIKNMQTGQQKIFDLEKLKIENYLNIVNW